MIYTYRNLISIFQQTNTWWYIYRNFISTFLQLNTWWYICTTTLYQFSSRWTGDDIYMYRNFISTFLQMKTQWYIHIGTLYQLFCRWTPDDMYIPKLNINFPAVCFLAGEHGMIYTYRNFISTFLQINTWWYIRTAILY